MPAQVSMLRTARMQDNVCSLTIMKGSRLCQSSSRDWIPKCGNMFGLAAFSCNQKTSLIRESEHPLALYLQQQPGAYISQHPGKPEFVRVGAFPPPRRKQGGTIMPLACCSLVADTVLRSHVKSDRLVQCRAQWHGQQSRLPTATDNHPSNSPSLL